MPFRFDIHALHYSDDAVSLETELHKQFADRALNRANPRKEFFFATPAEVREVLLSKVGNLLEYAETAEATEYRQSLGLWPHGFPSHGNGTSLVVGPDEPEGLAYRARM